MAAYCQIWVPVYYSDSGKTSCVYSRIYFTFSGILVYSMVIFLKFGEDFTHSYLSIRWNNVSNLVDTFSVYMCIQQIFYFSKSIIIFTYYCVFDGIPFSNSIFALTPTTNAFLTSYLFNQCLYNYYNNFRANQWTDFYMIGTSVVKELIKLIVFNGSIALFQLSNLNVYFMVIKKHVLQLWTKFQKTLFHDTLGDITGKKLVMNKKHLLFYISSLSFSCIISIHLCSFNKF